MGLSRRVECLICGVLIREHDLAVSLHNRMDTHINKLKLALLCYQVIYNYNKRVFVVLMNIGLGTQYSVHALISLHAH